MKDKNLVLYFLTENVDVEKEKNEIEYLQKVGKVVIVSTNVSVPKYKGTRRLILKSHPAWLLRLIILWSKLSYLFGKIANTASDRGFVVRNVYTGNIVVRKLINLAWGLKNVPAINNLFPTYDSVYFFPFKVISKFCGKKKAPGLYKRIVIHDSLVLRLNKFPGMVLFARENNIPTIGNVKSWDNPFYSQLATGASGYLTWSESMWKDVLNVHEIKNKSYHVWGARPFYKFKMKVEEYQQRNLPENKKAGVYTIGYAAAFCDELMGKYEIELLKGIAKKLKETIPSAVISFRPYPILPTSFYADLTGVDNIELVGIKGEAVNYDDGKTVHKLHIGSDEERLEFLSSCDCFLSIATSFSIEAAIFGAPIVHFYLDPNKVREEYEYEFFRRIEISDHILEYFNKDFVFADNYNDLFVKLQSVKNDNSEASSKAGKLLERMGIFKDKEKWETSQSSLGVKLLNLNTRD